MAVAVLPEEKTQLRELTLPQAVLYGTLYVLVGAWAVYFGIPFLWESYVASLGMTPFYSNGLRLAVMAAAAVGLLIWGARRMPEMPGLRAGIFLGTVAAIAGFFLVLVTSYLAEWLCGLVGVSPWIGLPVALLVAYFYGSWLWRNLHLPRTHKLLVQLDEQGWFQRGTFKKGQGLRIRRLTMLAILVIVGCGIYTFAGKRTYAAGSEWVVEIPFNLVPNYELLLLRAPGLALSVLIIVAALWFCYRLVNYPRFADFLIATEAEMNKVSWASPKHLKRDTIVVLVVTLLMTLFLWFMDILWSYLLVWLGVIHFTS
jgi:preprotein translocase SecE subunit